MVDVPSGLVRVQCGRPTESQKKKLKKTISKCDREIQVIDADRARCDIGSTQLQPYWQKHLDKINRQRQKLDKQRKEARLKLKGYNLDQRSRLQ